MVQMRRHTHIPRYMNTAYADMGVHTTRTIHVDVYTDSDTQLLTMTDTHTHTQTLACITCVQTQMYKMYSCKLDTHTHVHTCLYLQA